jgi:hypothetical protein
LKAQAYREGVLDLVRQGKISLSYGAVLLNMSQADFLELLRQNGIPVALRPQTEVDKTARPIWEIVEEIGASVPDEEWAKLPTDLSKNLDYYLYGAPGEVE